MSMIRLVFCSVLCCFWMSAYGSEAHIVIPKYGGQSGASSLSDETREERAERRQKAREAKEDEHQKKVDYYTSKYDPCSDSSENDSLKIDALFDGVKLGDIKCTKKQEPAVVEKSKAVAEKNKASAAGNKAVAEKNKSSPDKSKAVAQKSKAESEKQNTKNKQVYNYVQSSTFKSPVGANTQEEALSALNKQIDKQEQEASKPFLDHISGKITNRPTPTCKIGEHQKKWWCESTVTFTGQTYADPAKEKQATRTTKVQER